MTGYTPITTTDVDAALNGPPRTTSGSGSRLPAEEPTRPNPLPEPDMSDPPAPFPIEGFPPALGPLRDYFDAVAEAMQTPPEAVALLGLAIATTGALRKVEIDCGGWPEPAPLWVLALMPSGERKSALLAELTRPMAEWERDEADRLAPEIARSASQRKILATQLKRREDAAAKSGAAADIEAAGATAVQLAATREIFAPRLRITEATPEALAVTMAQNGERALVAAAEGDAVDVILGRYSDRAKPNLGVFLAGHAGDALTQLRIGRDSVSMHRPALALALIVQPVAVYDCYTSRAALGRGLLARFLACAPESRLGARAIRPAPVPAGLRERAWAAPVRRMLNWPLPHELTDSDGKPAIARFDPEGQRLFDRFRADLEPRLCPRTGDLGASDSVRAWASKLPGALARLALVMDFLAAAMERHTAPPTTITAATVQAALAWVPWLIDAQRRAEAAALAWGDEGAGEAGGLTPDQRGLVGWIRKRGGVVTPRDVTSGPRRFRGEGGTDRALAALRELADAGAGTMKHERRGATGPVAPVFRLNGSGGAFGSGDPEAANLLSLPRSPAGVDGDSQGDRCAPSGNGGNGTQ